jgi:DNA-binding CsgD family transcriptional regulator
MRHVDQLDRPVDLLSRITEKERAVLDLVLQHKVTKEIARELGVAPNTVDMRLRSAREKLGTSDRNSTARAYRGLLTACGKTTCGPAVVAEVDILDLGGGRDRREEATFVLQDAGWIDRPAPWDLKVEPAHGPEAFADNLGAWPRIALVVGLAALIAITVLATFAIADALARTNLPGFLTQ